jgi:glutamine synthetase
MKELYDEKTFSELAGERKELIKTISVHVSKIKKLVNEMVEARKVANKITDHTQRGIAYENEIRPFLENIRYSIDKLELIVDNEIWPLPKYRELMFN